MFLCCSLCCIVAGLYITASPDATALTLVGGISDSAKFRWTGLGLQHVGSSKIMHPTGDVAAPNTVLILASGSTAASGFSLVPCKAVAAAPQPQQQQQMPTQQFAQMSVGGAGAHGGPQPAVPVATKQTAFDLNFIQTWPACVSIKQHAHPLFKKDSVYKGTCQSTRAPQHRDQRACEMLPSAFLARCSCPVSTVLFARFVRQLRYLRFAGSRNRVPLRQLRL